MTEIGVLGTRQQLATVPVRKVTLKELVPVREAELTLAVEEKLVGHLVTFELFREREVGRSYKEGIVVRWMNPEILTSQVERSYWS